MSIDHARPIPRRPLARKPADHRTIRATFNRTFAGVAGLCGTLALAIWLWRILGYGKLLREYKASNPPSAITEGPVAGLLFSGGGWASLLVMSGCFCVMWILWRELREYLCEISELDSRSPPLDPRWQQRFLELEAIHEPPGDVFTLVGIGSTFIGLALGLVTLPSELISQVYGLSRGETVMLGLRLASAAIVFGSSLAIGLIGSLMGIMLSYCARAHAASFSAIVSSPSEMSDDLHQLHLLESILGNLEMLPAAIADALSQAMSPPSSVIVTLPSDLSEVRLHLVDPVLKRMEDLSATIAAALKETPLRPAQDTASVGAGLKKRANGKTKKPPRPSAQASSLTSS